MDIESEINLVLNNKGNIDDSLLAQKMREIGLERYDSLFMSLFPQVLNNS